MQSVMRALELLRLGKVAEAERMCRELSALVPGGAAPLELLADIQIATARPADAIATLSALLRIRPRDAAALRRLGGVLLSVGRHVEAGHMLHRAIELEPGSVRAHNNLGQAMLQTGRTVQAAKHFIRAIRIDPAYAVGYNNLGLALTARGHLKSAASAFRRAVQLDESLATGWLNLAIGCQKLGALAEALDAYQRVLRVTPVNADALAGRAATLAALERFDAALVALHSALELLPRNATLLALQASVLLSVERPAEALAAARSSLAEQPEFVQAYNLEAASLCKLNRPGEALRSIDVALQLNPHYVEGWRTRAVIEQNLGDDAAAVDSCRRAIALDPQCAAHRAALLAALIPAVPTSAATAHEAWAAFAAELTQFEEWQRDGSASAADAWLTAKQPLFYLSYFEAPNRDWLRRFRQPIAERLADFAALPPCKPAMPLRPDAVARRIRVGIVSAHVYAHSVYDAILKGWLNRLDPDAFEISLFSLGTRRDVVTAAALAAVERVHAEPRSLQDWIRQIVLQRPDVLMFPEVGMDRSTLALAHLRLAHRQLAAWGHPDTTGLPTIDAYLSAAAFEPADAERHYTERLVRLPNLGVYFEASGVEPTAVDVGAFGIRGPGPVFVCPGTPFKYRPRDDMLLVDIARRLGSCQFVFFEHDKRELSNKLHARIAATFTRGGLDPRQHLVWIPWMPRADFLGLLRQADVYLDTIGFSGFNTLMLAVEMQLPCVAFEGTFMRGRLGSGILRRLQLSQSIATTREQYVDLATALGADAQLRSQRRVELRHAAHRAYRDDAAIDALADTLRIEVRSAP